MTAQKKKPQNEEKEGLMHYCYAKKKEITTDECLVVSASKRNNRKYCKKNKCTSPMHLCLSCVVYDEIEAESTVLVTGKALCEFHIINGYFARKDENTESLKLEIHKQAELIQDCIKLRAKDIKSLYTAEEENFLDIGEDEEDISSEVPPELEQDEISEQDISITHKK